MSLTATNPQYDETIEDIVKMRDVYKGQRVVKAKGETYLPPTPGMVLDGMLTGQPGRIAYEAYKVRAVFPDHVSDAVEALIGLLHQEPATIELPEGMSAMMESATVDGESLQSLLRRINEQQLVTGRVGLLLDLPESPDQTNPMPFIALYYAESIRNWDDGSSDGQNKNALTFVVLDESNYVRNSTFTWRTQLRFRVLAKGDGNDDTTSGYTFGVFAGDNVTYDPSQMQQPTIRGKTLPEIPFVFINSKDCTARPDNPPLLGLAERSLTIYRTEADYRQTLFMQGQDTLVVIGGIKNDGEDGTRVGAGAKLQLDLNGDAKYIGVNSEGLPELRLCLEADTKNALSKTGQLVDAMGSKQESGEALKTRIAAQTATLNQIAFSGAYGLEKILKQAAEWLGYDPNKVKVIPNTEFAAQQINGKDIVDLMTAKNMGAPLSKQSLHQLLRERGITELSFDDETALIDDEAPLLGAGIGAPIKSAPNGGKAPVQA